MSKFNNWILFNRSLVFALIMALGMKQLSLFAQSSGEWFENGTSWSYNFQVNGQLFTETRIATFHITEQTIFADRECAKMELVDGD